MAPKPARKPPGKRKADPLALSDKERVFVAEYLISMNGTRAVIRAGFETKNPAQIAYQLLHKTSVKTAVDKAIAERLDRKKLDADDLLDRLRDELDADVGDLYDPETGKMKHPLDWPVVFRRGLVPGIETEELFEGRGEDRVHLGTVVKVKHVDRTPIKKMFGDHIGIQAFKKKVEHGVTPPLQQLYEQIAGRALGPAGAGKK